VKKDRSETSGDLQGGSCASNGRVAREITDFPATKRRYVALDGLRGMAALIVMALHSGRFLGVWVPRFGYLAVDLFFLLSGFVLAYSYEHRFRLGMAASEFLIARVVRLYPWPQRRGTLPAEAAQKPTADRRIGIAAAYKTWSDQLKGQTRRGDQLRPVALGGLDPLPRRWPH
jgi:hypothetical protein